MQRVLHLVELRVADGVCYVCVYSVRQCIRVFFRFMFCIPLLILGADGIQPHEHINDSM